MGENTRKLLAIMSADVVGYSRLMGDDEAATVETLTKYRTIFADHISRHDGRVVDSPGDNLLAEFVSPVEALAAAVGIQLELTRRNRQLAQHRQMQFRIGLNLGDVIAKEDGTLYGDGVNIAARLEALAVPEGVCISGSMYEQVRDRADVPLKDIGEQKVKNIERPVRAWSWGPDNGSPAAASSQAVVEAAKSDKPSIAVLAFDNMSGDPEQEYFADGIAEDVITDLSKIPKLLVIARNSSFTYKGKPIKVQEIAEDLSVRYVLEGSVRKAGDRVRVTAQLIEAANGQHLWAERYDRRLDDIFAVQDDVSRSIVEVLKVTLTESEHSNLAKRGTENLEAYDAFMRGREWTLKWTQDGQEMARPWLEKAIALDPEFAGPYAYLGSNHIMAHVNQWGEDWQNGLRIAGELATKAVALDDLSPHAHFALGGFYFWGGQHEKAITTVKRTISLDANFAAAYQIYGMALHYSGDSRSAEEVLETSLRLDPIGGDTVMHQLALCYFMVGNFEAAAEMLQRRIALMPDTDSSRALLAATYGHMGRTEDAQSTWAEVMEVNPNYSFAEKRKVLPYKNEKDPDRIAEGLRKAGVEE